MKENKYTISEAARLLSVENHVLRYWEEELELKIPRNELGHRYYREEEIQLLHCLLYTSPSPRDGATSRMPSSA